jgi:hypothetical protein
MCFHELSYKQTTKAEAGQPKTVKISRPNGFLVGDRVQVTNERGGSLRQLPATITKVDSDGYSIKTDSGVGGWFRGHNLELIAPTPVETPTPVATPTYQFKVGDRVHVKYDTKGPYWDGPGTVTDIRVSGSPVYFIVKTDSGKVGGFYAQNLTPITFTVTQSSVGAKTAIDIIVSGPYQLALHTAVTLASTNGSVTVDQVQDELSKHGYTSADLGNAAGAIFRTSKFRKVGQVRSTRKSNRGRMISQWELVTA